MIEIHVENEGDKQALTEIDWIYLEFFTFLFGIMFTDLYNRRKFNRVE